MSLANTALSFLRLPGEIRNKIYRELYEPPCPDDTPGLEYINPEWWIPSCEDLLALMRTCRQIHAETTHMLYSPTYSFHDTDVPSNLEFILSGPGRYLRQAEIRWSYLWDDDPSEDRSVLDIHTLSALATAAVNLERLEFSFSREFKIYSRTRYDPGIRIQEYSWVDDLVEVPCRAEWERVQTVMTMTRGQIAKIAKILKGIMVDKERFDRVERAMYDSEDYAIGMWETLLVLEEHKRFFGRDVVEVLKKFGPSLKRVDMRGTVDRKWMAVVVEALTEVTVRAQGAEGEGWVVVEPGGT